MHACGLKKIVLDIANQGLLHEPRSLDIVKSLSGAAPVSP